MRIALLHMFLCTYKELEKEHNIKIKTGQQILFNTPNAISKYHKFKQNIMGNEDTAYVKQKSHGCFMAKLEFKAQYYITKY